MPSDNTIDRALREQIEKIRARVGLGSVLINIDKNLLAQVERHTQVEWLKGSLLTSLIYRSQNREVIVRGTNKG